MRFTSSDHVKRHMRTHTLEKVPYCPLILHLCDQIIYFLSPRIFQPYKCKYCPRAFAQSNDLVKHNRRHVGINTYQCAECPLAFRLQRELREHGKIHFHRESVPEQQPADSMAAGSQSSAEVPSDRFAQISDEQMKAIEKGGNIVQVINLESIKARIIGKSIIITPGQIIDRLDH